MTANPTAHEDVVDIRYRFLERHKSLSAQDSAKELANSIKEHLSSNQTDQLRALLSREYPADLADAMYFLSDSEDKAVFDLLDAAESAQVLDELDQATNARLVASTPAERLAQILSELPADDATRVVDSMTQVQAEQVLKLSRPEIAANIRILLAYPKETAGHIMSLGYIAVQETQQQAEVVQQFASQRDTEHIFYIYVLDQTGALAGVVDLHSLLRAQPKTRMQEIMRKEIVAVHPDMDQEQAARIFARYDLEAVPVVEPSSTKLLGVITADDIIDVVQEEGTKDAMNIAGSDAEELEKRSPTRIALMRLPWIMATMFIELIAGLVIHFFDMTIARVILLASFMPIISAISGNTGLQSATIIVRGLSTGHVQVTRWQHAVLRQLKTTLLLGAATGVTLGIIGAIWYGKAAFGLVIFIGMFMAVNIAGVVGTVVPLISKSMGFDPALTSGPFETAFQDVVGISIFLSLATLLIKFLL